MMSDCMTKEINELALRLSSLLLNQHETLAVAESCTGGWLAKSITDLSGSSAWFLGGVVSYSNSAKQHVLGVQQQTIETYGAVSQQVAEEMACGVQRVFAANLAVSVTGIAGPSGGCDEKPVGLVWFAIKGRSHQELSVRKLFKGGRDQVRLQSVKTALMLLIEHVAD